MNDFNDPIDEAFKDGVILPFIKDQTTKSLSSFYNNSTDLETGAQPSTKPTSYFGKLKKKALFNLIRRETEHQKTSMCKWVS